MRNDSKRKPHASPNGATKKPRKATPRASNAAYQKAFTERQKAAGLVKFQRWVSPEEAAALDAELAHRRESSQSTPRQ